MTNIESSKRLREVKTFDVVKRVTVEYRYSIRCDNAREAASYAASAFAETEAGAYIYRDQHVGRNVIKNHVRSNIKVKYSGSSDFQQDDAGKLTICECEHIEHFNGGAHGYSTLTEVATAEQVKTAGGTFVMCEACSTKHAYDLKTGPQPHGVR